MGDGKGCLVCCKEVKVNEVFLPETGWNKADCSFIRNAMIHQNQETNDVSEIEEVSWRLLKMTVWCRLGVPAGERFQPNSIWDTTSEPGLFRGANLSNLLNFQSLCFNSLHPAGLEVLLWGQLWLHAGSRHLLCLCYKCRRFFLAGQRLEG